MVSPCPEGQALQLRDRPLAASGLGTATALRGAVCTGTQVVNPEHRHPLFFVPLWYYPTVGVLQLYVFLNEVLGLLQVL